jgi:undecaprenol kinase
MAVMKNRNFRDRLCFAIAGIAAGFTRERSFRTHCIFAGLALLALLLLRPAPLWWGLVAVVVALVLALELVNSARETVLDLLHPGEHPAVKVAKDMAAGAVLVISLAALIVALALVIDSRDTWLGWLLFSSRMTHS